MANSRPLKSKKPTILQQIDKLINYSLSKTGEAPPEIHLSAKAFQEFLVALSKKYTFTRVPNNGVDLSCKEKFYRGSRVTSL